MIKATFYKNSDDVLLGFSIKGHADYAEYGKDIICSAVSILSVNTINAIDCFTDNRYELEQGESGFLDFRFLSVPDEKGHILLRTLELGIKGVSKEYGTKFLQVHYKEV